MATLVSFHAHPDDESITAGGLLRRAADQGHRVVLVFGTRGELGEVPDGFLDEGEPLWQRRVAETLESARILGVSRTEFLGYVDSGMMGEPSNDDPSCLWQADIDQAAGRLAAILREEQADVLTVYDDNGGYGHPDHIQVHRVGLRAAELAGTGRVYQLTTNREYFEAGWEQFRAGAEAAGIDIPDSDAPGVEMGKPEAEITGRFDVSDQLEAKRASMRAHASQISEHSLFLGMPEEAFAYAFGVEWAIRDGQGPGITETDPMAGLPA
ncbi:PIG-L family deacetylase [Nakamurella sp.]|uniref:PIG-L family deacetylase n=1 Tax=Nakamurella sp. TaxID=1869182 RepID=UPI0037834D6E